MNVRTNGSEPAEASIVLRNARIVDPRSRFEGSLDLWIENGRIREIGRSLPGTARQEVDLGGAVVLPGLFDLHALLGEPGGEDAETIATAARAAARGGFTAVACMPGTPVPIDTRAVVDLIHERERVACGTRIHPVCALTRKMEGQNLTEMWELSEEGAVAASDADHPIQSSEVMRRAMEYARMCGLPVLAQGEDRVLRGRGMIHEGYWSTVLGLRGIPAAAEEIGVARNISLARLTKCHLHVQRVSTRGTVDLVRRAKAEGLDVTAETSPSYLALTTEAVRDYETEYKVNPPLRSEEDRRAVRDAVRDGTIDVVVSDHLPNNIVTKDVEFDSAPFGVVGLETAFSVAYRTLVEEDGMPLTDLVDRMSIRPRKILGLPEQPLTSGAVADLTVVALDRKWTVAPRSFASLSRSTPFGGWELPGQVLLTIAEGRITYRDVVDGARGERDAHALPAGSQSRG